MVPLCRPALLTVLAILAWGCEERIVRNGWDRYNFDREAQADTTRQPTVTGGSVRASNSEEVVWAINLATFEGSSHTADAEQRRTEIAKATGFDKGLWVSDESWRSQLYFGRYKEPGESKAMNDLAAWKEVVRRGRVAIPLPILVPTPLPGSKPQFNLLYVPPPAYYTFQIGHYDPRHKGYRQVAETEVLKLREEGVEAYYYHGPNASSVTIGTFTENAVKSVRLPSSLVQTRITNPRALELQEQYARYLINGEPQEVPATLATIPR